MELQKKWVAPSPGKIRKEESDNYIVAETTYKIARALQTMYYTEQVHTEDDTKLLGRILNGGHMGPGSLTEMVGLIDRLVDYQNKIGKELAAVNHSLYASISRNIENLNQWRGFVKRIIYCQLKFEAKGADDNWNPFSEDMTMHWLEVTSELPLMARDTLRGV